MNISEITEQEFADNFDFIMDMIERNKTTFKIIRKDVLQSWQYLLLNVLHLLTLRSWNR